MNQVTPVTCFCIYGPYMLINQHTATPEMDLQIQSQQHMVFDQVSSGAVQSGVPVTPVSSIGQFYPALPEANYGLSQAQSLNHPSISGAQGLGLEVNNLFTNNQKEKLPRIERVFSAIHNSAELQVGSPGRSTNAESSYGFEEQTPANNHLFESKLCQLYQNLNAEGLVTLPNVERNYYESLSAPFQVAEQAIQEPKTSFECAYAVKKTSDVNVLFEVSRSFQFGSDHYYRNSK